MDDGPDSIALRYLRQLSGDMAGVREDMREVKQRLGRIVESVASVSRRVDRPAARVERERRLDLIAV